MKCAYCGQEAKGTREHIISCGILDLFPECFITFDTARNAVHEADPTIKDVCAECNNQRLSYIDSYAKDFIGQYFTQKYSEDDTVEIQYDYTMIQKMLLKYAFNDLRSYKKDYSFFDPEILHYLLNKDDITPKTNVTVLCGLAVNVSPVPDTMFGNQKLRWGNGPIFYSNSIVQNIDYETGEIHLNDDVSREDFPDLKVSYVFRFNSVQFLLLCWDKESEMIERNNIILRYQYPYHLLRSDETKTVLPICTDEINYHQFEQIHVQWDGLFEVGAMRKMASGGRFQYKDLYEKAWAIEEENLKRQHPR